MAILASNPDRSYHHGNNAHEAEPSKRVLSRPVSRDEFEELIFIVRCALDTIRDSQNGSLQFCTNSSLGKVIFADTD